MKHRQVAQLVLCMVLGLLVLTGSVLAGQREFIDMVGNKVIIPTPDSIERVAVLTSPQVQIMYIIGQQDKLVAMTQSQYRFKLFEKFYPAQANIAAPRRQAADMNVEALLAANPQFCIGSSMDMDLVDKATRIPTVRIDTSADPALVFETRKAEVTMFGEIFGAQDRAKKYCDYLDATLNKLKERTAAIPENRRLKVYMGLKHPVWYAQRARIGGMVPHACRTLGFRACAEQKAARVKRRLPKPNQSGPFISSESAHHFA